jgi:hypothetical protein
MQLKLRYGKIVGFLTKTEKKKLIAAADLCATIAKVDSTAAKVADELAELAATDFIEQGPSDE